LRGQVGPSSATKHCPVLTSQQYPTSNSCGQVLLQSAADLQLVVQGPPASNPVLGAGQLVAKLRKQEVVVVSQHSSTPGEAGQLS